MADPHNLYWKGSRMTDIWLLLAVICWVAGFVFLALAIR